MAVNASEEAFDQLQEAFVVAQRQAMLGMLSGIIAHEYNNLMTPVLARAQDALSRDDLPAMRKALSTTLNQTDKALHFTRQVLEVAHGREMPTESCNLADLVRDTITASVRPFDKDGIELTVRVPEDLQVRAHRVQFIQVLLNILLNARAAMKERRGRLTITAQRDAEMVVIAVRDAGVGMTPEMLNEVINPFLAADVGARPGDWSGIGMGLQACRIIAQRHGARLRAELNEGAGCTFFLAWPAA